MGDFFSKVEEPLAKPGKKQQVEEELITDFQVLCKTYDTLKMKIDETTTQGYEVLIPLKTELLGGGKTADDRGQVGILRRRIETSRMYRIELGNMMWSALKNIEDLNSWSERYTQYLEEHIDAMKIIARSGFVMINKLRAENAKLREEMMALQERMVETQYRIPPPQMQQPPRRQPIQQQQPADDEEQFIAEQSTPQPQQVYSPVAEPVAQQQPLTEEEVAARAARRQELFEFIGADDNAMIDLIEKRFPPAEGASIDDIMAHRKFQRMLKTRLKHTKRAFETGDRVFITECKKAILSIASTPHSKNQAQQAIEMYQEYYEKRG